MNILEVLECLGALGSWLSSSICFIHNVSIFFSLLDSCITISGLSNHDFMASSIVNIIGADDH